MHCLHYTKTVLRVRSFVCRLCFTALGHLKLMLPMYVSYIFAGMMPLGRHYTLLSNFSISVTFWMYKTLLRITMLAFCPNIVVVEFQLYPQKV